MTLTINPIQIVTTHILSMVLYAIAFVLPFYIRIVLQLLSGFWGLILLPGLLLNQYILSIRLHSISFGIITGLVVNMFWTQILFIVSTFSKLLIPLPLWLWSFDTSFIVIILLHSRRIIIILFDDNVIKLFGKKVFLLLLLGHVIRVILALLAEGSIAPDGSLYADYARHLLNGQFESGVLNDGSVIYINGGTQFITHQGFAYLFAIGWLLFPPGVSGPVIILIIVGSILPVISFYVAYQYFDIYAARWIAVLLSFHPLFVFHSAVAYGPEISSLTCIVMITALLLSKKELNNRVLFFVGFIIGVVDILWYSNYYALFVSISIFLFIVWKRNKFAVLSFALLIGLVFVARIFLNLWVFIICVLAILLIISIVFRMNFPILFLHNYWFFGGLLLSLLLWRWPFLLSMNYSHNSGPKFVTNYFTAFSSILNPLLFSRFLLFLVFHTSIIILVLALCVLYKRSTRMMAAPFFIVALVATIGTFGVFVLIGTESLQVIYLFSDSRFFLFIVLAIMFGTISFFVGQSDNFYRSPIVDIRIKGGSLLFLICIGFLPGYLGIPSGFELVNIENRYGWDGLNECMGLVDHNAVILVDRARELAWYTTHSTVTLQFSTGGLPTINASRELILLADKFGATYFLLDSFTISRWNTMNYLLTDDLYINESTILFPPILVNSTFGDTVNASALQLICQTNQNKNNCYARLFRITSALFQRELVISFLESGWTAGNGGTLSNDTGLLRIQIGTNTNYSFTTRRQCFDLGLRLNSGFGILQLHEVSATVSRIELWGSDGRFLRCAESLGFGKYYLPYCNVDIGDIRIVIKGNSNSYVVVDAFSFWEYVPTF